MKGEVVQVEPLSGYANVQRVPVSMAVRCGDLVFISGQPPHDPGSGEVCRLALEQQAQIVLEQMKLCLTQAGCCLENDIKCNVCCTDPLISRHSTRSMDNTLGANRRQTSSSMWQHVPDHSPSIRHRSVAR
jgi:enamine deaminase RidA (YjgF/YER057c/UK114 family)